VKGCYKVVTHNLNWDRAGMECRSLHENAHLLVINNAAEQAAVATMTDSINRQCFIVSVYVYFNYDFWYAKLTW